jgi:hypothetical protein
VYDEETDQGDATQHIEHEEEQLECMYAFSGKDA